ncbi:hypothetical protein [Georgenia sp.]
MSVGDVRILVGAADLTGRMVRGLFGPKKSRRVALDHGVPVVRVMGVRVMVDGGYRPTVLPAPGHEQHEPRGYRPYDPYDGHGAGFQFALITPVMLDTGRPIHRVRWAASSPRTAHMCSLITMGTIAAYGYALVLTSFPGALPSNIQAVYPEAVGVIITLILLGRLLETPKANADTGEAIGTTIDHARYVPSTATKIGWDTMLAQIVELVRRAPGSQAPTRRLADRVSGSFVPAQDLALPSANGELPDQVAASGLRRVPGASMSVLAHRRAS